MNMVTKQTKGRTIFRTLVIFGLILLAVIEFYPIFYVIINSFKSMQEFYLDPLGLPSSLSFENIIKGMEQVHFFTGLKNNLIVLAGTLMVIVIAGSLLAYPIARAPSKVKYLIYTYLLIGLILPEMTLMVPLAVMMKNIGLINSHLALILAYSAKTMPLTVVLYSSFMRTIPGELAEAARIDGASKIKIFFRIYFPMLKTTTATIVILNSVMVWNDFLMPSLLLTEQKNMTLMPLLYSFYGRQLGGGTRWDIIFPAMSVIIIPVILIFVLANRSFIKGMTDGALKG